MSFNQQLRESRVLGTLNSRLYALMAFVVAALIAAGCSSAPSQEARPASRPMEPTESVATAEDLTATEAAIARMNESAPAESTQPTAQLIRPDAPMNYTVARGDTLWDIAAVFLKDPWFWPEIWQINPQVENPHLIYPGDVLSLAYGAGGDAHVRISQYSGARLQPSLRSEPLDGPIDTIPFAAIASFLSRPGVLSKEEALTAPHIVAFRDDHIIAGVGHEIYVQNLNAEMNARYNVMHVAEPIRDTETGDLLGYQAIYVGTAVVNTPGPVSKAKLTDGAREAFEGDRLISADMDAPLSFTPHAPRTQVDGQIISVVDGATQIGQYQVVVINRGTNHSLDAGTVLAIDQQGIIVPDRHSARPFGKPAFAKNVQLPSERVGTLIVFRVFDRMSYGLVIGARGPMRVADRIYNP